MDSRASQLERWSERLRRPMAALALASLPVIVLDASHLGMPWDAVARAGNWLIWLAFTAELIVLLSLAPARGRWLAHHPLELGIVLLTPPFLPASLQAARIFRLLLVLRFLATESFVRALLSVSGLRYVALLAVVIVLGGGTAFAAVEHAQHLSSWDGVWWAIVTVTTVGYGDITPKTDAGRMIAIAVMLGGIGFVAIVTAAIAQRFVAVAGGGHRPGSENGRPHRVEHELTALHERLARLERER
jgi:voltage-gated potassium channel